jgi:hypothetical protein
MESTLGSDCRQDQPHRALRSLRAAIDLHRLGAGLMAEAHRASGLEIALEIAEDASRIRERGNLTWNSPKQSFGYIGRHSKTRFAPFAINWATAKFAVVTPKNVPSTGTW